VGLIVVGLVLATFAATYWRGVLDRTAQSIKVQDITWKKQAREQLFQLQDTYSTHRDPANLQPMIDKARELVDQYPQLSGAHVLLGQMLLDDNKLTEALEQLQKSLELNQRQPHIQYLAGNTALMIGNLGAAEKHISQAISMDPTNGRYRLHMAMVYLGKRKYPEARMTLLQALNFDSSLHEAHSGLSDLYARQNKLSLALQQINKAIDRTPDTSGGVSGGASGGDHGDWVIYMRKKANLLRRANKPGDALRILEGLSPRERINPAVMNEVALCFALMGKPQQAASLYEQALIVLPMDVDLLVGAVRWHHKAGDIDAAKLHLRSLRKIDPQLPVIKKLERLFVTTDR